MQIAFETTPEKGTVVTLDKVQHYELIAIAPYTRKSDGASSSLLTWRVLCHDCGHAFEFITGLVSKNWRRRCDKCKCPLKRISGRRRKRRHVDIRICSLSDLF